MPISGEEIGRSFFDGTGAFLKGHPFLEALLTIVLGILAAFLKPYAERFGERWPNLSTVIALLAIIIIIIEIIFLLYLYQANIFLLFT